MNRLFFLLDRVYVSHNSGQSTRRLARRHAVHDARKGAVIRQSKRLYLNDDDPWQAEPQRRMVGE